MTDEEFREKLIAAIEFIGGGKVNGPSGIEGLAMAVAGNDFITRDQNLAAAVYAVAAAIDRIADHLETTP